MKANRGLMTSCQELRAQKQTQVLTDLLEFCTKQSQFGQIHKLPREGYDFLIITKTKKMCISPFFISKFETPKDVAVDFFFTFSTC